MLSYSVTTMEESTLQLIKNLQQGGYNLYFRHAEPITNSGDPELSDEGKEKAKLLGILFQEQKINIQLPVLVSSAKRARQTAEIAFGRIKVETALFNMDMQYLTKLMESIPPEGSNAVLVGHLFTFNNAIPKLPYLGVVILKPNGAGKGFEVVQMAKLLSD